MTFTSEKVVMREILPSSWPRGSCPIDVNLGIVWKQLERRRMLLNAATKEQLEKQFYQTNYSDERPVAETLLQ